MNMEAPADYSSAINIDAEQCVIAAVMANNATLGARLSFLEPEHFSEEIHQKIFSVIQGLIDRGRTATPLTIPPFLDDRYQMLPGDMPISEYLANLFHMGVMPGDVRDMGLIVLENYACRKGAAACYDGADAFLHRSANKQVTDITGDLEDELASIRALAPRGDVRSAIGAGVDGVMDKLANHAKASASVIPFPLPEIGTILQEDGWEPGNLYGLVASSGEGKSSLMLQIIRAAADAGHPVLLLSFDQNLEQVARQMLSQAAGISLGAMRRKGGINDFEAKLILEQADKVRKLPLEVIRLKQEKIGRIAGQAQAFAKRWKQRTRPDGTPWGAPMIVLDHNRKVTPDDPKAHEGRIAGAVNGAGKALAEEIGGAVLFLNQRNSNGMKRDVPRPIAADLFGGEQSREDYDSILYLYRAEKWRDEKLKVAGSSSEEDKIRARFRYGSREPENLAELGAIKVRYGQDNVREIVAWEGRFTRYLSERETVEELF
jgi:replicative DNA helicase